MVDAIRNDKESLAMKAKRALLQGIVSGDLTNEGKLPSEGDLCNLLSVSRSTVRSALKSLQDDGLITVRHGLGSFVNYAATAGFRMRIDIAKGYYELIMDSGHTPSIGFSSVEEEFIPDEMRCNLLLPENSEAIVLRRQFLADGKPAIFIFEYIPKEIIKDAFPSFKKFESIESIYEISKSMFIDEIEYTNAEISTEEINEFLEEMLGSNKRTLLKLREIHYSKDNKPIMFSIVYVNDDIIRFQVCRRKPLI